jgi:ParB-like chromosome segregation protein Spo0J
MDLVKVKTIKVPIENIVTQIFIEIRTIENTPLAIDIKKNGIKNPIYVEDLGNGKYRMVDGYHRYYIGKSLGFKEFICTVVKIPEGYNWRKK